MYALTVRIWLSFRNAMYSVTAAACRRSYSSAFAIGCCMGSFALRISSIASSARARPSSLTWSAYSWSQSRGTSWTFFRYQL